MTLGAAICLWLKIFFLSKGLDASHEATFDTLMNMRVKFAKKMTKLPLGDITNKGTGSYKKNFVDDMESLELLIAHMVPEGIPYVLSPIVVFVVLFIIDCRLAFLSLASIPIGFLAVIMMMRSGLKKMDAYYQK